MIVERWKWITREEVRANPDKIFLFGDNLEHVGMGGQAGAMRGEQNAIGIPTKKTPSAHESAFFTDDELVENCNSIEDALMELTWNALDTVVIPADGLGTGLAELDTRAPKTFAYLQQRLLDLDDTGGRNAWCGNCGNCPECSDGDPDINSRPLPEEEFFYAQTFA